MRLTDEQQTSLDQTLYPQMQPVTQGSYSLNSPQLDQIATTYAGPTWVDNGTAGGKYVDQWGNESYDGGQTWMSPGEIQAGAGQPAFAPQSWNEPQPIPDTYSLGFNGTAFNGYGDPGAQNPWDTRFDQQPDQGGGFWNSAVHAVNDKLDYILPGTFDSRQKGIEEQGGIGGITAKGVGGLLSGNALIQGTTGYDPSTLPYGLGYITDVAAAPATYIGLGVGGGLGGTSWEVGKQIGSGVVGNLAAKAGMSDTAESIPYFGDQPAWLRGLEAGALGGIAAYGAADIGKGFFDGITGAGLKDAPVPKPDLPTPGEVGPAPVRGFTPVNPEDIAFGKTLDTGASTGMRAIEPPSGVGGAIESLPNKTLAENFDTASKILAKLEDNHGHMVLNGDPQAPVVAARLAKAEEGWQLLSDEVAKRLQAAGVTDIKALLRDESGQVDLGAVADATKALVKFAAPIATRTALGAGVGAAYGEASGMGWEKGAAIGGGVGLGFGVLGKAAGAAASRGVEARLAKNTRPEAADKLISLVKQAAPVRESQQELYSQELGRRSAQLASIQAKRGGEAGVYEGLGTLRGELPKARFDPVRPAMSTDEISGLINHINDAGNLLPLTKSNAQVALIKTLNGELPTRSEISLLGKVFGEDFSRALLAKRSLGAKAWENTVDALNLPRTLMTSWDASAPLRQGAILFAGHPIAGVKATGTMIRAMASPKYAELVRQQIENSPNATIYEKMGLYFADTTSSAALTAREEQIMSRLAGKIPGVGGSQRGYTTFLNKLRQDVADNFIAGHPNLSNKELKDFGHVINIMSGRGDLPKFLQDNSAILNAAFAPRYAMSRLQLPVEMVKAALPRALGGTTGAASKELARDVIAFAGTGAAILTLGKLAGVWNVELDPRSTDFGKGKMGNTRFDFWAGEQQIARYAAQLVGDPRRGMDSLTTGQRKTSTGQIVDANRLDTIGRWLQTKKSPAVGLATDLLQGKDFVGNPIDLKSKGGIGNQAWQRLAPLFLQDMADAAKLSGNQWRALSAAPSAVGAGVQTYQDSDYKKRSDLSKQMFGNDYYSLTVSEQQKVDDAMGGRLPYSNPEVQKATEKATATMDEATQLLNTGTWTPDKAKQWRQTYNGLKDNLRFFKDVVYADAGTKPGADPVLDGYYKAISDATFGGQTDWTKVDSYKAKLDPGQQQYIDEHTGKLQIDTSATRAFQTAQQTIEKSGFFDTRDKAWAAVQAQMPEAQKYPSYDQWYQAKLEAAQQAWKGQATPEMIDKEARKVIDKMDPAKAMKQYGDLWENQWMTTNPAAAYQAWHWGYWTPTEDQAKWLNSVVGAK